jgi:predicted MPP superfamily phosphohydrolase
MSTHGGEGQVIEGVFLVGLVVGHAALAVGMLCRVHALGIRGKWLLNFPALPLVPQALVACGFAWLIAARSIGDWPREALVYAGLCNVVAWVVWPASIMTRALRRPPGGVTARDEPVALRAPAGGIESWIGDTKHAGMLRWPGNEALTLRATSCDAVAAGLPRSFGALRILHLSDFHFARCYARGYFEAVAESAAAWESDLVVFTGDLVDDDEALDWAVPVLGRLRGRLGQFAILGNHDYAHRPARVRRAIRAAGFIPLDGKWMVLEDGPRTIALGGTSAPWGPGLDPERQPEADATIVLSHAPDEFPRVASWGTVDLVLAGHNHGGQVRLPGLGPLVMPSRYGLRYDCGVFRRGRTLLEVTRGVGGKHPLRYGCPPEVVRITLRAGGREVRGSHRRPRAFVGSAIADHLRRGPRPEDGPR